MMTHHLTITVPFNRLTGFHRPNRLQPINIRSTHSWFHDPFQSHLDLVYIRSISEVTTILFYVISMTAYLLRNMVEY